MPKAIKDLKASAVVDLKAQLAQHKEQFDRQRAGAKVTPAARRSDKKPVVWARQNKGVADRSKRDQANRLDEIDSDVLQRSRQALEQKAKLYDAMARQVRNGSDDDDDDDESQLIDFDQKYWQDKDRLENEQKEKEKRKRKRRVDDEEEDEDPWVEYVDEFGRTRVVRKSDLPSRSPSPARSDSRSRSGSPEPFVPRSPDGLSDQPSIRRYDASRENRARGAAFYELAKDEETRAEQLRELNRIRQETVAARQSAQSPTDKRKALLSKKAEKRHARMAELQAKQQKSGKGPITPATSKPPPAAAVSSSPPSPPPPPADAGANAATHSSIPAKRQTLDEFLQSARRKVEK